jgi:thymidylate kinase
MLINNLFSVYQIVSEHGFCLIDSIQNQYGIYSGGKMKFAFTGSHGTGKTTLATFVALKLSQIGIEVSTTPEIPRVICEWENDLEFFRRENNTLAKQLLILFGQPIYEISANENENLICDRTLIDHLAYTNVLFKEALFDSKISKSLEMLIKIHMQTYDEIFYLPIEFSPKDDGVRESDEKFQKEIDNEILRLLKITQVQYNPISGSIEDRTRIVVEKIKTVIEMGDGYVKTSF